VVIFLICLNWCVFLRFLLWRHCQLFISWDYSGRQCWGWENRMGPRTQVERFTKKLAKVLRSAETGNLWKFVFASKVKNPFTRALEPHFIGRQRDFYIPKLPPNLENSLHVNTYKNVIYTSWFADLISHIYKSAICSHFEPGLLMPRFGLGLPLTFASPFTKATNYTYSRIEPSTP
jgi:hypothetical protein